MTAYRTHLAKRDCVQDCPVPSCAGIECAGNEICVFMAQTCQACPTASCVSLDGVGPATSSAVSGTDAPATAAATSSNDSRGRSSGHSFPAGALASVIVVGVLLLLALISLFFWVRRRRRNIARGVLADSKECGDEELSETKSLSRAASGSVCIALDKSIRQQATSSIAASEGRSLIAMSEALRRSPSQAHTLPICLDEDSLRRARSTLSGCADLAGVDGNKHFFDADELMRMSYAASHASMISSSAPNTLSRHFSNGTGRSAVHRSPSTATAAGADNEAAIIQANKQVMAVRAKANVVQLTKLTSPTAPTVDPSSLPGSTLPPGAHTAAEGLSKARCVPMVINTGTAAVAATGPRAKRISMPQRTSSIQRPRSGAPVRQSLGAGLSRSNSTASAAALYNTASFLDFDTDSVVESPIERDYILLTPKSSSNALSSGYSHGRSHSGSLSHARNGSGLNVGAAGVVGVPSPLRGVGPRCTAAPTPPSVAITTDGERPESATSEASDASAATSSAVTALGSPRSPRSPGYAPSPVDASRTEIELWIDTDSPRRPSP